MNRERQLTGVYSYTRELGFDPVAVLVDAHRDGPTVAWLDLCCGTARAPDPGRRSARRHWAGDAELVGVDLVDAFDSEPKLPGLTLICAPAATWTPHALEDLLGRRNASTWTMCAHRWPRRSVLADCSHVTSVMRRS
jgi:hypothetical protein